MEKYSEADVWSAKLGLERFQAVPHVTQTLQSEQTLGSLSKGDGYENVT